MSDVLESRAGGMSQGSAVSPSNGFGNEQERAPIVPQLETRLPFPDLEPWPDRIQGDELLDQMVLTVRRFLVLPDGAAETLSLWAIFTHCFEAFSISPRLGITSPTPECGKTTVLEILGLLVRRP